MRAIARGASRGAARRLPRTAGRRRILACAAGPLVARSRRAFAQAALIEKLVVPVPDAPLRDVIGHPGMQGAAVDARTWLAGVQPVAAIAPRVTVRGHGKPACRAAEAIAFDSAIRFARGAMAKPVASRSVGRRLRNFVTASRRSAAWRSRAWSRMFAARPWLATDARARVVAMTGLRLER